MLPILNRLKSAAKGLRSKRYVLSALLDSNYTALYQYEGNVLLRLDKACDHDLNYSLVWRSKCEPLKRIIVSKLISSGNLKNKTILDIGAYIGDSSIPWLALSSHLNHDLQVCAIDPCQENIDFIKATALYNNLEIIALCSLLSDRVERYAPVESWSHSSFQVIDDTDLKSVTSSTLDSIYANIGTPNVGLIHIDVEGMEYQVLNGSKEVIKQNRPIIIYELHLNDPDHKMAGSLLRSHGYMIYTINEIISGNRPDCRNMLALPVESTILSDQFFFSAKASFSPEIYPIVVGPPVIPYEA